MGASRTGSYQVTPPGRARASGTASRVDRSWPRQRSASVDGGSHPDKWCRLHPYLTVDGMPHDPRPGEAAEYFGADGLAAPRHAMIPKADSPWSAVPFHISRQWSGLNTGELVA
jgi:hypothetical protein